MVRRAEGIAHRQRLRWQLTRGLASGCRNVRSSANAVAAAAVASCSCARVHAIERV